MSSLLQFSGNITRDGVHLQFVLKNPVHYRTGEPTDEPIFGTDAETFICPICGREHAILNIVVRKPAGMFGTWVVFRYNGEEHVPDLSVPINVFKLPRDAQKLDAEKSAELWHRS